MELKGIFFPSRMSQKVLIDIETVVDLSYQEKSINQSTTWFYLSTMMKTCVFFLRLVETALIQP